MTQALTSQRLMKLIIIFMLAVATVWGGFTYWMQSLRASGPLQFPAVVVIEPGESTRSIAKDLYQNGIIESEFVFRLAARASLADRIIKAGEYSFEPAISVRGILKKITGGDVVQRQITIPEGLTYQQVRQILLDEEGLRGPPLEFEEGALLPETYDYRWNDKRTDIMRRMARAMTETVTTAWENRAEGLPLDSPSDLLILASIVEKETRLPAEYPLVASVYVNRLNRGMRLQSDPTVIYGATDYTGDITYAHLKENQPYNTYVHKGLPPSPIANPGRAAIMASANPADTDYLYFVADGFGGHVFSKTYEEHKLNVAKMLTREKELQKERQEAQLTEGNN